eukprot:TRINITY_DN54801_c0_g1_i1.p1 TRINITY_DN54801_c0_g1~~TRINITY_DN54801_c0_g1_i1.p1  ORF type:complete len:205 (+),score=38.62 TRINITY_DN54801_c0_g1_i1:151-765(+)
MCIRDSPKTAGPKARRRRSSQSSAKPRSMNQGAGDLVDPRAVAAAADVVMTCSRLPVDSSFELDNQSIELALCNGLHGDFMEWFKLHSNPAAEVSMGTIEAAATKYYSRVCPLTAQPPHRSSTRKNSPPRQEARSRSTKNFKHHSRPRRPVLPDKGNGWVTDGVAHSFGNARSQRSDATAAEREINRLCSFYHRSTPGTKIHDP